MRWSVKLVRCMLLLSPQMCWKAQSEYYDNMIQHTTNDFVSDTLAAAWSKGDLKIRPGVQGAWVSVRIKIFNIVFPWIKRRQLIFTKLELSIIGLSTEHWISQLSSFELAFPLMLYNKVCGAMSSAPWFYWAKKNSAIERIVVSSLRPQTVASVSPKSETLGTSGASLCDMSQIGHSCQC